jgi:hypothetical protein
MGLSRRLFHPRVENGFRANVNVVVEELGSLSPGEYLTVTGMQVRQVAGRENVCRDELAPFCPGGHLFEWIMPMGRLTLRVCQLIVFDQARAFVISATAPAEAFSQYWPEFQGILESFQTIAALPTVPS